MRPWTDFAAWRARKALERADAVLAAVIERAAEIRKPITEADLAPVHAALDRAAFWQRLA